MKNSKKIAILVMASALSFNISAQNEKKKDKHEKGEIKVITVKDENGKVTKTEETYQLKDLDKVQKILKKKGIELNMIGEEGVTVDVKEKSDGKTFVVKTVTTTSGNKKFNSEDVKVFTIVNGNALHSDDDVKVTIEEIEGGNAKKIKITSLDDNFSTKELYLITEGDELENGETMVFIRKNTKSVDTDLPNSINQKFDGENSLKDLNLFPNPTNGNFKMEFKSENPDNFELSITDSKGAKVYEKSLGNFEGQFSEDFDLSKYDSGIYFFNLTSKGQNLTKKIIMQ
ncbi:MAG: hypothetical protein ACJARP_001577 [Vicingaceae bacterium]|jgi:hypothetical protein